jgi:aspartyl-tRNA(Asn)/glutamyl-tRNA(Gln) amidotransferase subunit A
MTATQSAKLFANFSALQDPMAVERLRTAGAIKIGVGVTSEFACVGVTNIPLYGMTRNPVDRALTADGSSGGPSAAVAAGFAALALGTGCGRVYAQAPRACGRDRVQIRSGCYPVWSEIL